PTRRSSDLDVALDEEGNRLDTEERRAPDPGQHGRLLRPDARDGGTTRPRPSALPNPAAEPASYRRPTRTVKPGTPETHRGQGWRGRPAARLRIASPRAGPATRAPGFPTIPSPSGHTSTPEGK